MKNLLSLREISTEQVMDLLKMASSFKSKQKFPTLDKTVANLFFEPSTRTHYSFIKAELNLDVKPMDFTPSTSSLEKGESLRDTVQLFQSLGVDALVIRHRVDRYYEELTDYIYTPIINAGDGKGDHPTQSLLDLMTILEEFDRFEGLKCLIYGDIKHSRVANTNVEIFKRLGMDVSCFAPEGFETDYCTDKSLDELIPEMDVVMGLRVQNERHEKKMSITQKEYLERYGLTEARYQTMKDRAILLHPAPVNRGWEIQSNLVDAEKSRIFKQMENGLYVRMAVLYTILG